MFQIFENPHSNVLLNQVVISNASFKAVIYPNLGATLQQLELSEIRLIDGITADQNGLDSYAGTYNSSFLFPFPNRISKGSYSFENKNYQLICNENGRENAIHGCLDHAAFELLDKDCTEDYAMLSFKYSHTLKTAGFPLLLIVKLTIILAPSNVAITIRATNTDTVNFPYGFGWHPYFLIDNFDKTILSFDGDDQIDCDEEMIPIGRSKHGLAKEFKLNNHAFDTGFVQETSHSFLETNSYKVALSTSNNLEAYLQVYTPPHQKSIAIEPMSCIADSFNNHTGLRVLKPNESVTWDVQMDICIK